MATGPSGQVLVTWSSTGAWGPIVVSERSAGGEFSRPQFVTRGVSFHKAISIGPRGDAVIAWVERPAGGLRATVVARWRAPGSRVFAAPVVLATTRFYEQINRLRVALGASGIAVVGWDRQTSSRTRIVELRRRSLAGRWAPADRFARAGQSARLEALEVDAEGAVLVQWWQSPDGGPRTFAIKASGGRFSAAQDAPAMLDGVADVSAGAGALPGFVWLDASADRRGVSLVGQSSDTSFEPPAAALDGADFQFAPPSANSPRPFSGFEGSGIVVSDYPRTVNARRDAVICGQERGPSLYVIRAGVHTAGTAPLATLASLATPDAGAPPDGYPPRCSIDEEGQAIVQWYDQQHRTWFATGSATGFSKPQMISSLKSSFVTDVRAAGPGTFALTWDHIVTKDTEPGTASVVEISIVAISP